MTADAAPRPLVGIVMGSDSDYPVMRAAEEALAEFGIEVEVDVVSAHRMPEDMSPTAAAPPSAACAC